MVRNTLGGKRLIRTRLPIHLSIRLQAYLFVRATRRGIFCEGSELRNGTWLSTEISRYMNRFVCNSGRRCSMCLTIRTSDPQVEASVQEDLGAQPSCFQPVSVGRTTEAVDLVLFIKWEGHVRSNSP